MGEKTKVDGHDHNNRTCIECDAMWVDGYDACAGKDGAALAARSEPREGPSPFWQAVADEYPDSELTKMLVRSEPRGEGLRELRAVIAAVEAACPVCGGDGWTIGADPLPSGEPGEPYQVPCWDAEHSVILNAIGTLPPGILAATPPAPALENQP